MRTESRTLIFPLGEIVATANAKRLLAEKDMQSALIRHSVGDWGEVCPDDAKLNDESLTHGGRLLSVYQGGEHKFWIITEDDRSVTTVLMPDDY